MPGRDKQQKQLHTHSEKAFAQQMVVRGDSGNPVDYIFVYVNPAFENISGLSEADLVGKSVRDCPFITQGLQIEWFSIYSQLKNVGENTRMVKYNQSTHCWYEIAAYVHEPDLITLYLHDMAKQKEACTDVNPEAELAAIMDNLPLLIARFNSRLKHLYINKALERLFGIPFDQLKGKSFLDLADNSPTPELKEQLKARHEFLKQSLNSGKEQLHEGFLSLPEGRRLLSTRIIPERNGTDGKVTSLLAITQDITRQKETEDVLKESWERYKSIITVSNTGAWEYNRKTGYLWCSPEYFKMLGRKQSDYIMDGRPNLKVTWNDLMHQGDNEKAAKRFKDYLTSGSPGLYENSFRMLHKDGHWVWIWSRGQTLKKPDGSLTDITVGTHIDITEHKKTEQELLHLSRHDSLTSLYNRYYFEELINDTALLNQYPISIIIADLNGLKLINDSYGSNFGDELLKTAALILKQCCRENDILARWGGDEFIILMPQTSLQEASKVCKSIDQACSEQFKEEVPLSLTLGLAEQREAAGVLFDTLREAENNLNRRKLTESRSAKNTVLQTLLTTLAEKSFETEAHTRRMQAVGQIIGHKLKLTDAEQSRLKLLITLHDIGKINISEQILTKKGPLTEQEWAVIKTHPEIGFRIAWASDDFKHVAEDILAHHERWDGKGYPQGLKEWDIPLLSRITAIADSFEVMTNGRPYKRAMSKSDIKAEFMSCSGTQFDPELIELFLPVIDEWL